MRDARLVRAAPDRVGSDSATGRLRDHLSRRQGGALGQRDRAAGRFNGQHGYVPGCDMVPLPLKTLAPRPPVARREDDGEKCAVGSSAIVAGVDNAVITVRDVEARINKQPPFVRARYTDPAKKRELVDELVQFEAIAAEAARRAYD